MTDKKEYSYLKINSHKVKHLPYQEFHRVHTVPEDVDLTATLKKVIDLDNRTILQGQDGSTLIIFYYTTFEVFDIFIKEK
jgi:hypothetical protein